MSGYIGAHIIGGAGGGYSRDSADRVLGDIGGKGVVVVNDAAMVRKVLERGGIAAHRINRPNFEDDDGDAHFDAVAYVNVANIELSVAETGLPPDRRGVIYLGNEIGTGTPARTEEWLVRGCDRATALNRKVVMGNWSYLNPYDGYFPKIERAIQALKRNGGWMGHHEGSDAQYRTFEAAFASGAIGGCLKWKQAYGYKVWLTEFAGSLTAHDGYKALYAGQPEQWVDVLLKTVVNLCAPHDILLSIYTMFEWQRDFAFYNDPALIGAIASINRRYPVMTQIINPPASGGTRGVVTAFPVGVPFRNLRVQPFASAADVGDLNVNDEVVAYASAQAPDWRYVTREADGVKGWALWTNVTFVPALLPPVLPGSQGVVLTPEQALRLRGHAKAADDAAAGIMAVLDEAEGTPGTGTNF